MGARSPKQNDPGQPKPRSFLTRRFPVEAASERKRLSASTPRGCPACAQGTGSPEPSGRWDLLGCRQPDPSRSAEKRGHFPAKTVTGRALPWRGQKQEEALPPERPSPSRLPLPDAGTEAGAPVPSGFWYQDSGCSRKFRRAQLVLGGSVQSRCWREREGGDREKRRSTLTHATAEEEPG